MCRRVCISTVAVRRILWLIVSLCLVTSHLTAQNFNIASELGLGISAFDKGKYGDAILHLERVVTHDPSSVTGRFYLAEAYDKTYSEDCVRNCAANERRRQRALEEYNRTFELDPSLIGALKAIAWRYDRDGHRDEAEGYYRKVVNVVPNDFEVLYNLAVLDWKRSYQFRAEKRSRLKLGREPLIHTFSCAEVRAGNLGRVEEGIALLERAVEIDESSDAQAHLSLLYREHADIQCENQSGYDRDLGAALQWARRACATRHRGRGIIISASEHLWPAPALPGQSAACPD